MSDEIWKPVVGFEDRYEVSNLGRVSGRDRYVRHGGRCGPDKYLLRHGGVLSSKPENGSGYRIVRLLGHTRLVHRLVLEAFSGPCPEGMEACHNNGNRRDNRIANLRWDTRKANHADKKRHGTNRSGRTLSATDVERIKDQCANGVWQKHAAAQFGVTQAHVSAIVRGLRW